MDLIELRLALRRNWYIGLAAAVLVAVIGILSLDGSAPRYRATSTLIASPQAERLPSGSTAVLRVLLPNVVELAESDRLARDAARILQEDPTGIEVVAEFEEGTGVLSVVASALDGQRAIAWSRATAQALVEAYEDDPYLGIEAVDAAIDASQPGALEQHVDLAAVLLLSLLSGVIAVFAAQRVRESSDVVSQLRRAGIRVVGELPVAGKRTPRQQRTDEHASRRLALSLSSGPGIAPDTRFVVIGDAVRPTVAVVDAMRNGLAAVGRDELHRVSLGPAMDDPAAVHRAADGTGVCVAVLDQRQRVDQFMADVKALGDADVPVAGVVVLRRG
jgi:hypothetical protein